MGVSAENVGKQIYMLRKAKNITQQELGEGLNVSFQAVSKWERGETLPDTAILPDLAAALDTTIDSILTGGESSMHFKGKKTASDMKNAICAMERVGSLAGRETWFYRQLIEGLSEKMNADISSMLSDDFLREILVAELIIQNMALGYYFDLREVKGEFKFDKAYNTVFDHAKKIGIA